MTKTTRNHRKETLAMKKTLIVAAVAVALVFAFAATAMARPNGNIYIKWDATGANAAVPTPHAGYTTATEKCNVCHSVHYAATSSFTWPDTSGGGANTWTTDAAETQMLLRSSVANACNYCHIQTSIGGVQIYGGIVANYTTASGFNHYGGPASCTGCHAVHGANTFQGANLTKILRVRSDRPIQAEVIGAAGGNPAIAPVFADANASGDGKDEAIASGDKYTQQVAFCTQCHQEYTDASESTITGGPGYWDGSGYIAGSEFKGHPLKTADETFTAAGDTISMRAAWAGSSTCRSCHDAGNVDETGVTFNSFPHYTAGYYVFSYTGSELGSQDASDATKQHATDGNCLKCHVNTGGAEGVGKTF